MVGLVSRQRNTHFIRIKSSGHREFIYETVLKPFCCLCEYFPDLIIFSSLWEPSISTSLSHLVVELTQEMSTLGITFPFIVFLMLFPFNHPIELYSPAAEIYQRVISSSSSGTLHSDYLYEVS